MTDRSSRGSTKPRPKAANEGLVSFSMTRKHPVPKMQESIHFGVSCRSLVIFLTVGTDVFLPPTERSSSELVVNGWLG